MNTKRDNAVIVKRELLHMMLVLANARACAAETGDHELVLDINGLNERTYKSLVALEKKLEG
jgi:hypothetical protein